MERLLKSWEKSAKHATSVNKKLQLRFYDLANVSKNLVN